MKWDRLLTELEMRALCEFVLNPKNKCVLVANKSNPSYMDEGLDQTLYKFERSNEYVFISRQKGYIRDAVHIEGDEIEEFISMWNDNKLTNTGHIKKPGMGLKK